MGKERIDTIDGQLLQDLTRAGLFHLEQNKEHVNTLNVFPVPDGDTGTNMVLTMRAACAGLHGREEAQLNEVAQLIADGALMGARGNSGVILSQIWRGFQQAVGEQSKINVAALGALLRTSAETAYKSVMNPVEGTMLTIIRAMAVSAENNASTSHSLSDLLNSILADANIALANTPNQLPILKQAGVVDSGGQGLIYIFEGMLRFLNGQLTPTRITHDASHTPQKLARPSSGHIENPYDVQFILQGNNLNLAAVRQHIDAMGDSTVVVGDAQTIKVHVHVQDPGQPLSYGAALGTISDVVVENMQEQMEGLIAFDQNSTSLNDQLITSTDHLHTHNLQSDQIGLVATAPGAGIAAALQSLGVAVVVNGGQSNNPSTEEIHAAINAVPSKRVIVLPNNKNIQLAAEAAAQLSTKTVYVVPTRSVPEGIAALIAYDANGEIDRVAAAMQQATSDVVTAEITTAVRDVTLDDVAVTAGALIGLVDGRLVVSAETLPALLPDLLNAMQLKEYELLTLYYGATITADGAAALAANIEADYPELEIEILSGEQPHYDYILGAE